MKNRIIRAFCMCLCLSVTACDLLINADKRDAHPANVWTVLSITNDSSKTLIDVAYSGDKVCYDEWGELSTLTALNPGHSFATHLLEAG